jgi:two-component system, NtrC family, response regulator HydG
MTDLRHHRALIIDDDSTFCRFLAEVLDDHGMEATWTTDGRHGYELTRQQSYDVVISDVRMPGLLGTDLAAQLKADNSAAKIILISAFADESLHQRASQLGIPVLSKPFGSDRLLAALTQALGV